MIDIILLKFVIILFALPFVLKEQKKKGVIAASAGNHALALSYHGNELGIHVTVVMPINAPIMKISACRKYKADVHVNGADIIEVITRTVYLLIG